MANSTAVLTDANTLAAATPTTASTTKYTDSKVDVPSLVITARAQIAGAQKILQQVAANLDTADPMQTLANNILGTLQ